jgi:AcrR family transcriptional regulator
MQRSQLEGNSASPKDLGGLLLQSRLPVGRGALVEPLVANSQRERLLDSVALCCAQKGYNATTIADIVEGAGISRATFYELFKDKEDCFCAAMELALADTMGRIVEVYSPHQPWATNIRDTAAAILELLANRPAVARMVLIEALASGGRAFELYASAKRVLQALLDRGREDPIEEGRIPSAASRAAIAAAESLITGQVLAGNSERLPELLPDIVYITTIPYLGREEALRQSQAAERSVRARAA